jgi:3-oxoacyl-[acyl-carrier protein] reductase
MNESIRDKIAIVTGSAAGIGKAIAKRLSQSGVTVVIVDLNSEQAVKTSDEIRSNGGVSISIRADVSKTTDVKKMVEETVAEFGTVHILVNNAGIGYVGTGKFYPERVLIENYSEEDWDRKMNTNLKSMFLSCKYVVPYMKRQKWGKIVSIASRTGRRGQEVLGKGGPAYGVSKAGMINLTKTLARQLGPFNINVNCIAPDAIVGTGFVMTEEEKVQDLKNIPLGRLGKPDDVAGLVEFLCSDSATFIQGTTIDLDGGSGMW